MNSICVCHRIHTLRDEKQELPEDFLGEIYKWALECKYFSRCVSLQYKNKTILDAPNGILYEYSCRTLPKVALSLLLKGRIGGVWP
jgi:hypothetical protein